jgi:formylmethanofuran dehydrogenase subunit B
MPPVATAAESSAARVCTACPLLCDDVVPGSAGVAHACAAGAAAFRSAHAARGAVACRIDGRGVPLAVALDRGAATIAAARRVLVTGLSDATLEAVGAACDLAETVAAAVDAGGVEVAQVTGPTIARIGEVTAEWEELRDRADLVVFWFCDPTATHPRFVERFVAPPSAGAAGRRTLAIGPDAVLPAGGTHRHVPVPAAAAVDAARLLQAAVAGVGTDAAATEHGAALPAAAAVAAALADASCAALVTRRDGAARGLAAWSAAGLVRSIALARPAFEVPLAGGIADPGANVAGAAAVCTWRYGAAGAIARADRRGAAFLPAESDANRLIERGEVDCVVAVGRLAERTEAALAACGDRVALVRVSSAAGGPPAARAGIEIGCSSLLARPFGTMLRGDGRLVVLGSAPRQDPDSMTTVLAALHDRVRAARSAAEACA